MATALGLALREIPFEKPTHCFATCFGSLHRMVCVQHHSTRILHVGSSIIRSGGWFLSFLLYSRILVVGVETLARIDTAGYLEIESTFRLKLPISGYADGIAL